MTGRRDPRPAPDTKAAYMQEIIFTALVIASTVVASTAAEPATDVSTGEVLEYPHAGIALAVPKGFEYQAPVQATEVVRAVRDTAGQASVSVMVLAVPVKMGTTADVYADQVDAQSRKVVAIKDYKVLKKTPVPMARLEGTARLVSFTAADLYTIAVRAYFVRELTSPAMRICYVLVVAAPASEKKLVLPTFGAIVKTARLIDFKSPSTVAIKHMGPTARDEKRGYLIRLPRGWHIRMTASGMELLTTDYLAGGVEKLHASVTAASIGPDTNAAECAMKFLNMLLAGHSGPLGSLTSKVLTKSEAKMAGYEAFQVIVHQTPKTTAGSGPGHKTKESWIIVQRTICALAKAPGQEGPQRNAYALTIPHPGEDPKLAAAIMDKLAAGFAIIKPALAARRPGTRPATTRPSTTSAPKAAPPTKPAATRPAATSAVISPAFLPATTRPATKPATTLPASGPSSFPAAVR